MSDAERRAVRRAAKNFPIQGACANGLKLALALLWERRDECPEAVPLLAVHDEIVVEVKKDKAEAAQTWLKKAMVEGMERVLNDPESGGPRVPVEVETKVGQTWA
jgi:DNA polymerase-1